MTFDDDRPEDVLVGALDGRYAYSSPYDLADAWGEILENVTPAEALSLSNAARTIGRGTAKVVRDPAFGKVLATAAPLAGTALGGPLGGAAGAKLGSLAAARLAPGATGLPGAPVGPPPARPGGVAGGSTAGGSTAATQLLILLGQPAVQQALLQLALGEHGSRTPVNGVAVPDVTRALSTIAAQTAEDADGLFKDYADQDDDESVLDVDDVYRAVIDAADAELDETVA